ncbi:MAG: MarR family transcriptional regulator [Ectothiorhodospiraceae bacterium]|nr:MarR family transcriptional regulator [Ectothiorhodospiraceae bacterium]
MSSILTKEATQAWIQLHRAHRLLLARVEETLKTNNLPPLVWYDVLFELSQVKEDGLRQYEIGEKILLYKHNLSRLLDRLEKKHFVKRYTSAEDARGNRIIITSAGIKLMNQIWPIYRDSIRENFAGKLSVNEFSELNKFLCSILE